MMPLKEGKNTAATFEIRSYYVSELAMLYNPRITAQAATRQLRRWIEYHPHLGSRLTGLGYFPGQRCFTPKQVACIVEHLGEP